MCASSIRRKEGRTTTGCKFYKLLIETRVDAGNDYKFHVIRKNVALLS